MSGNASTWQSWAAGVVILGAAMLIGYALPHGEIVEPAAPLRAGAPPEAAKPSPEHSTGKTLADFAPPPESAIPNNEFGDVVRLGENIFRHPQQYAPQFVGNDLTCQNCHLDSGRLASAAPLWAAYVNYPAYRSKNGHVNSFAERLQGCFRFSMNGKAPPYGDKVLVALETYAFFLAKGAPTGAGPHGYEKLKKPNKPFDLAHGKQVFAEHCALCHAADGQGQASADGEKVFPPLWGPRSFNWGAGMGQINNAAAFIKANMPLSQGGVLSDDEAWDVAAFMDSHERPQDPRFSGSIDETRKKYHDTPMSFYGSIVNGVRLGEKSPPSGS